MAKGDKPQVSVTARAKSAPKGSKDRTAIMSAWPGKFPGSYTALLSRDVAEIVMKDGTRITADTHWLDIKDWASSGGSGPRRSADTPTGEPGPGDDIPFHHIPRTAKDIS